MDELLKSYFSKGFSYENILTFLAKYHDIHISMRTLQRLYRMGLKRRNIEYDINEVQQEIINPL